MQVVAQFVILHVGDTPRGKYCVVCVVGYDNEQTGLTELDNFHVFFGFKPSMDLPVMTLETFRKVSDLYHPQLLEKVEAGVAAQITVKKNFKPENIAKVESWLTETWTVEQIREHVGVYI